MPLDIVDIQYETATAAPTRETYNDVLLVTTPAAAPTPGYNTPSRYSTLDTVAADYGTGSDAYVASEVLDAMGVESWFIVALQPVGYTETLGNSTAAVENSGTVTNTPITGTPTITVDGTAMAPTAVTASPPDANGGPAAGEAYYNPDTGEVVTGTSSSGTGAGIVVDYQAASWDDAKTQMGSVDPDVAMLANRHSSAADIGDLDELITWGAGSNVAVVAAGPDGRDYTTDADAMNAYHEIASYLPAGNFSMFAHKSSDDVAAYIAGQMGVERPWHDVMYYAGDYPGLSSEAFRSGLIGEPGQNGTFEGGDADGTGPVNVLIQVQGSTVASNSLTTAGAGSNYRYLDVWRTERFAVSEARRALTSLAMRVDDIPFNGDGRVMIVDALKGRLAQYIGSRQPFTDLNIQVPERDRLSDDYIANRVWGPITISGTLTGNAHTFEVRFAASV